MNNCPKPAGWHRHLSGFELLMLIDNEFTDEAHSLLMSHVVSCTKCHDKYKSMLEAQTCLEKKLSKDLQDLLRKSNLIVD